MPKQFDKHEMEAHIGQSVAQKVTWRVKKVLPEYFEWPRKLRQIYIMLATHGSSDAAINDIIAEFGWDKESTWEMISGEHNFLERLIQYREEKRYPKHPNHKNPLTHDHLAIVFAEEARFESLAKLQQSSSSASAGSHLREMVGNARFLDVTDAVGEKPAIQIEDNVKVPGIAVEPEIAAQNKRIAWDSYKEASLSDGWDKEWAEYKDAVPTSSETEGDAPVQVEGEVGAGGPQGRED